MSVRATIKIDVITAAIERVRSQPIHESFAGYLAIRAAAVKARSTKRLRVDFKQFFNDYLAVSGSEKPYLKLFIGTKEPSFANLWLNENVAGSYALSSMRPDYPLRKAARGEGSGQDTRWSLEPDHAAQALTAMCNGKEVSPVSLSTVLYRDFTIEAADEDSLGRELLEQFKADFDPSNGADFRILFRNVRPLTAADFDIEK